MPHPEDNPKLRAELEAVRAERDAAVHAFERHELEAADQVKLLVEEQDRFVSRLLERHEREVVRLRLELEEARNDAQRYAQKMDKERARTTRLEDDLLQARGDADRIRDQRDAFRLELRKAQQAVLNLQATTEHLEADLRLAKAMLNDAIEGTPTPLWESAKPPTQQHEVSRAPRDSGIQNRRDRGRARVSTPPGRRPSAAPRAAVGDNADKGPPSSR